MATRLKGCKRQPLKASGPFLQNYIFHNAKKLLAGWKSNFAQNPFFPFTLPVSPVTHPVSPVTHPVFSHSRFRFFPSTLPVLTGMKCQNQNKSGNWDNIVTRTRNDLELGKSDLKCWKTRFSCCYLQSQCRFVVWITKAEQYCKSHATFLGVVSKAKMKR